MATNLERIKVLEAWKTAHDAKHAANPLHPATHTHTTPDPEPPPPPPPPPTTTGYGCGVGTDSKNNLEIGRAWQAVSHRFVAGSASPVVGYRWAQRFGPGGYSGGNGGKIRISIQADSGGNPSGTILTSAMYAPTSTQVASNKSHYDEVVFAPQVSLVAGSIYHVVYENLDPAPTTNWQSVNDIYIFAAPSTPRQPAFPDTFAVLVKSSGAWALSPRNTPVFDLRYGDGSHDGNSYYEPMIEQYAFISGTSQVREVFTPTRDVTVSRAMVRIAKVSGTDPLTVTLAGASATIPASAFPVATPNDAWTASGGWGTAVFPAPITLKAGTAYSLRLTTAATTRLYAVPIRKGQLLPLPELKSYRFLDGRGEKSTDGGSTWSLFYQWDTVPPDVQFWLLG